MKLVSSCIAFSMLCMAMATTALAQNNLPTLKLGVNESTSSEVVDGDDVSFQPIEVNGFVITPLKLGIQIENNLVKHSGSALVVGADMSYI